MKTFKDIISELTDPTPRRQKEFIDKHTIQVIDYPVGEPDQLSVKKIKKDKTKKASLHDGEDAAVYEETMSDTEMKKREDIVKGMKKNKTDFQKRYGDKWKSVMYATATKSAMKEEAELEEAFKKGDAVKPTKGPHKGVPHEVIHDFGDGNYNIKPKGLNPKQIRYSMGAAKAHKSDLVKEEVEQLDELSPNTLSSYASKANIDASKARSHMRVSAGGKDFATHKKRYDKRTAGAVKAGEKYRKLVAREETELDEAVEVSHDRYMRSHGKKASGGEGNWMFTHKRMGDANVNDSKEVHSARGKFSDAKKSAQQWAKKHGHSTVYVMEEVALDEVSDKKLDAYRQKAFADQPAGDDGSDKYRKRKFGRDLAFAKQTGRAKVRATKEEVELDEVSQETLRNYHAKAALDLKSKREKLDKGTLTSKDYKQGQNRVTGLNRSANKMEEYMDEAFKAGAMKLSDGSSVKLTSEQASTLNALFNELNSSNKKKMEERLMSDAKGFNEILAFAKEAV